MNYREQRWDLLANCAISGLNSISDLPFSKKDTLKQAGKIKIKKGKNLIIKNVGTDRRKEREKNIHLSATFAKNIILKPITQSIANSVPYAKWMCVFSVEFIQRIPKNWKNKPVLWNQLINSTYSSKQFPKIIIFPLKALSSISNQNRIFILLFVTIKFPSIMDTVL